ncbi:MAG: hypothetical protein R2874_11520 [Desulfobacterales bacterium]
MERGPDPGRGLPGRYFANQLHDLQTTSFVLGIYTRQKLIIYGD